MASQPLLLFTLVTLVASYPNAKSDGEEIPSFAFSWLDDKETFRAGDSATIKVRVLGNYESGKYEFPFEPNITVNDKMGNSSFVTGLCCHFDGETQDWSIGFIPIMVGLFNVLITDENFHVLDSSLHFQVIPGVMYPSAGILSWFDGMNEFIAGSRGKVLILPKDAFGNNVSSTSEGSKHYNFSLSALTSNGSPASLLNITYNGWNEKGYYLSFDFIAATAGNLLLHVEIDNQTLHGSPMSFVVNQGELDVRSSVAQLKVETKYFQLFSMMEGFIKQQDQYGNVVSGFYEFDIEVIEKGTNLSMPLADLVFRDIGSGIQSFSFSLQEPGDFMLLISDKQKNTLISNMPYDFNVYIGYCDGVNSIVNGSGLNNSVAGDTANFSIFLRDAYLYPSQVELQSLQVQIVNELDSQIIHPTIRIRETSNDSFHGRLNYRVIDIMQFASAPMVNNNFTEKWNHKASDFDVTYKLEKIGVYNILVFCGNIVLNGGKAFRKEVSSGVVNVSLSGVVKFEQKVAKMVKNEIVVRLIDSCSNPVLEQQSKLKLEIASINKSAFSIWMFSDNHDGSYTAKYLANDVGTYEICASYNGERFLPCPFGVNVYEHEYFPQAYNDTVSVWEDESIDFNVLVNDLFAGDNASIVEYSKPDQGSLLVYGSLFRYTPYKGYYGNDSFSYTISDINQNLALGVVDLLILCRPPQFVSIPSNLQATEDIVSPTFGGFAGFEIVYSDLSENISITLSSNSGTVLLSPLQMQFWQSGWDKLSVQVGVANELNLVGSLEVVNFALQFIQYFGKQDFYGADTIRVSTRNKNGKNDIDVPIYVQPINDPPIINTPSFIILDNMSDGVRVFGKQKDTFNLIQDPDLVNFPGNKTRFLILLAMEVSAGLLSTSLPSELVGSTEVKQKSSYQWQPLQTFVTISKHFLVKAKGIRFRATIDDCNNILELLSYHEGEDGAVLSLRVNDLGNHGCYPNCDEIMSMSLLAESTLNLITHKPIASLAARTLGLAIILESITMCSLGLMLLFFICKCALLLLHEKKRQKFKFQDPSKQNIRSML